MILHDYAKTRVDMYLTVDFHDALVPGDTTLELLDTDTQLRGVLRYFYCRSPRS